MSDVVQVPGYQVIRPLGVGGMASVYLALQESLDREVALKVMAPALAANREFTDRFLKEGRITAKLSHPNLVTIFDIGSHGSIYYLAAEFIPGGTLRERLGEHGIPPADALDVMRDVAQGLHYAHEKGFVHRDVKPGNVLFRANGTAVLADFGIAKSMHSNTQATQAGSSIGTPHYMSPEQARAEPVDGRSDLYSLGAMFFEMLTGKPPYLADDPFTIALMHVTHPVPKLPANLAWLQPLIDGLMAKSPGERFATGEAFIAAMDKLLLGAPQAGPLRERQETRKRQSPRVSARSVAAPAAPLPAANAASRASSRAPLLVGLGVAGALLVAGVVWMSLRPDAGGDSGGVVTQAPIDAPADPRPTPADGGPTPGFAEPVGDGTVVDAGGGGPTDALPPTDVPQDIPGLLQRAREYVKLGVMENGRRLTSPEGDCAVDLYKQVLRLDPDNADARAGLDQIADFYESKAKVAWDRQLYNGSQILAEEGLKAAPEHAGLQRLLEESRRAQGL